MRPPGPDDGQKVDRSVFRVDRLDADSGDKAYWRARSPQERMATLELLRQIHYGYDPAAERLQRVFEIAKLSRS